MGFINLNLGKVTISLHYRVELLSNAWIRRAGAGSIVWQKGKLREDPETRNTGVGLTAAFRRASILTFITRAFLPD